MRTILFLKTLLLLTVTCAGQQLPTEVYALIPSNFVVLNPENQTKNIQILEPRNLLPDI